MKQLKERSSDNQQEVRGKRQTMSDLTSTTIATATTRKEKNNRADAAADDADYDGGKTKINDVTRNDDHRHHTLTSPRYYLIIVNIQKFPNVCAMVRAAIAFGCYEILLVGQTNNSQRLFEKEGKIDKMKQFAKWTDCVEYMNKQTIYLIGVEIDKTSKLLNDEYFEQYFPTDKNDIGILMGNEGQGILPKFLKECSALIRIPQYGVGTASLNVNVATNIILHRFSMWKRINRINKKR